MKTKLVVVTNTITKSINPTTKPCEPSSGVYAGSNLDYGGQSPWSAAFAPKVASSAAWIAQ